MSSDKFIRIKLLIILVMAVIPFLAVCSANATCGWTATSSCVTDSNGAHGAYCDMFECNCGAPYIDTSLLKVSRCVQPAWICPNCCPKLLYDVRSEWKCSCDDFKVTIDNNYQSLNPKGGESVYFLPTITNPSNQSISISFSIAGRTMESISWDGKNADGDVVEPGTYNGNFTYSLSGGCSQTVPVAVSIEAIPEDCNLQKSGMSTVDLASGVLGQDIELFTTKSSLQPLTSIITFNSLDPYSGPLGKGWNHNYDISLRPSTDGGSMILREGNKRRRYWKSSGFFATPGDFSTLVKNADNSFTVSEPDGTIMNFDTFGKIFSISDRYGNTVTISQTSDSLTTVDNGKQALYYFFDNGKVFSIMDTNQKYYTFTYYPNGRLWKIILPATDTDVPAAYWEFTYTTTGKLETKRDPSGNITRYGYDASGRANSVIDPVQQSRSMLYNAGTTDFHEKDGGVWKYTYNAHAGRLMEKVAPDDGTTSQLQRTSSFTYYSNGLMKSMTEPGTAGLRYTTFYTYDSMGNMTTESIPLDCTALGINPALITDPASDNRIKTAFRYQYDLTNSNRAFKNRIASISDERGGNLLTTTYHYSTDAEGYLVTTITDPSLHSTIIRQHADGRIKEVTDANQVKTKLEYDNYFKNLYFVEGPSGIRAYYSSYDFGGNNMDSQVADFDGVMRRNVHKSYDARNRLREVTITANGQSDTVTTYGYDDNDNLNSVKDAEQKETKYLYNFNRQVIKITDASQKNTNLVYGGSGCPSCGGGVDKLTTVEDAMQQRTIYSYDKHGRLEYETDPKGKKYHYTYHPSGKLDKKYNATSGTDVLMVTYSYNSSGQLTGKQYATGGNNASYQYDNNGRLQTASNANISYTFSNYTGGSYKGRLKNIVDITNNRTVSYDQYTNIGQRRQITVSDSTGSRTTGYQYDNANRPWYITAGTKVFTYLYDKLGRRDTISYPNGITAKHTYDNLDRLTGITHSKGAATITFANYSGFDKTSNRKSRITPAGTDSYTYDDVYRLKTAITPNGTENYDYDDVGNRRSGPGPKDNAYAHDGANRMTHGKQLGYDYDDAGNQTTRTIPNAPDKGWTLTWDLENRLTQMQRTRKNSNGEVIESRTIDFKYDPFNRRIEKKLTTFFNGVTKVSSWSYLYDGSDIAVEYFTDNGTTSTTYFTHGPGIDEHLAMERSGQNYYYLADGLGSITALTNESAVPVQTYSYDSFGVSKQTSGFRNSFMFAGREWDWEAGLYYNRYRYYDPSEGRFISKDPISFAGGDVNLFAYVQNNPINFADPNGLEAISETWSLWNKFKKPFDAVSDGLQLALQLKLDIDKFVYLREGLIRDKKTREKLLSSDLGADPCKIGAYNRVNDRFNEKLIELSNLLLDYGFQINGAVSKTLIGTDIYSELNNLNKK